MAIFEDFLMQFPLKIGHFNSFQGDMPNRTREIMPLWLVCLIAWGTKMSLCRMGEIAYNTTNVKIVDTIKFNVIGLKPTAKIPNLEYNVDNA